MTNNQENRLLTTDELSDFLQISKDHLARMRMLGEGPRFLKLANGRAGAVRYRMGDVMEFLCECERGHTD